MTARSASLRCADAWAAMAAAENMPPERFSWHQRILYSGLANAACRVLDDGPRAGPRYDQRAMDDASADAAVLRAFALGWLAHEDMTTEGWVR